jgi:hypothetical protein
MDAGDGGVSGRTVRRPESGTVYGPERTPISEADVGA